MTVMSPAGSLLKKDILKDCMWKKKRERQQQTNLLKRDHVSFTGKSSHWINVLASLKLLLWFINAFTGGMLSAWNREWASKSGSAKGKSNCYFMFNCHRLCTGSINLNLAERFISLCLLAHSHRCGGAFAASCTRVGNHADNYCPFRTAGINCAFPANRFMPVW